MTRGRLSLPPVIPCGEETGRYENWRRYKSSSYTATTPHPIAAFLGLTMVALPVRVEEGSGEDLRWGEVVESAFAPYVGFGVLMTSKLGANKILMIYITALVL